MSQIIIAEGAAPSTPATGAVAVYAKTDGRLYIKDDTGAEIAAYLFLTSSNAVALGVAAPGSASDAARSDHVHPTTGLELVANKAVSFSTVNDTLYPSVQAVKTYVDTAVTGLLDFKGATDCSANPNYPAASKGDFYVVSVAGKIGGASGTVVEAGDTYYATEDNAGGTEASVGTSWAHVERNVVFGTGVATALGINVGSAGSVVVNGGALGTPSSGVATNLTGTASGLTSGNVTYAFPSVVFASLPAASSATNQVYRISDVGPAPGILLISDGTIWRPLGGRQVLAMRVLNPVTVQSLSYVYAETLGPFPGGLVRAGMRLEMPFRISHGGISSATRNIYTNIGNTTSGTPFSYTATAASGYSISSHLLPILDVLSDSSVAHRGGTNNPAYGTNFTGLYTPTVDFSQAWYANIQVQGIAETAVNITAASWAAGVATYTATAHTLAVGDKTVIAGITPSGYNIAAGGIVTTVPDANTFTIAMAADPGAYTSGGTSSRISNMISQSYVLELIG